MMQSTIKRLTALLLACMMLLSLTGCAEEVGDYRILRTVGEESFSIGYRVGDTVALYVDAALRTLAAEGTVHKLAIQWLGTDNTAMEEDADALDELGTIPKRTLIVGVSESCFPLSYSEDGEFSGFDIALAKAVCKRLGWEVTFQAIARSDIYIQLSSGNVDCIWGGMPMDDVNLDDKGNEKPMSQQLAVSEPYLKNEIILVTRGDTEFSTLGKLNGETLMMDSGPQYIDALSSSGLQDRFGQIQRVNGGAQQCFNALRTGQCAAILTDSVALSYYTNVN